MATATNGKMAMVCTGKLGSVRVECTPAGVVRVDFLKEKLGRAADKALWPWAADLQKKLSAYLNGEQVSFEKVPVDVASQPPFRRKVLETCRRIPFGKTLTYTDLAKKSGQPAAVRAAGSAMSHNPIPIIIPCHRVLRRDGGLGGFSAPGGVGMKRRLLEMEQDALCG